MQNENNKLSNIKMALLAFLFIVMFSFAYFLLYAPIKVNDNQLLIITMTFAAIVVSIPLYVFMENDEKETPQTIQKIKKNKKSKTKK